jgi:N-glycosylase/DNA lyase
MKDQRVKQAQRVLANRFASFYYTGQTRGFEKWKEFVRYEKHKASLIKKTLDHWKKYQFYCVKSCFQNWMRKMDI